MSIDEDAAQREVARRVARRDHDAAQAEITRINVQIGRLVARRSEQERIVERTRKEMA